MNPIFIRAPYNYDTNQASDESGLACLDKSRVKQEFAEEADINTIVNRFMKTGQLPDNLRIPTYHEFTEIIDFQTAMNAVRLAQESFDALPAQVRARFHNQPQELLEFVHNPDNYQEAMRLGVLRPQDIADPDTGEIPADTAAAPATPKVAPSKEGTT